MFVPVIRSAIFEATHDGLVRDLVGSFEDAIDRQVLMAELFCFDELETFNEAVFSHFVLNEVLLEGLKDGDG